MPGIETCPCYGLRSLRSPEQLVEKKNPGLDLSHRLLDNPGCDPSREQNDISSASTLVHKRSSAARDSSVGCCAAITTVQRVCGKPLLCGPPSGGMRDRIDAECQTVAITARAWILSHHQTIRYSVADRLPLLWPPLFSGCAYLRPPTLAEMECDYEPDLAPPKIGFYQNTIPVTYLSGTSGFKEHDWCIPRTSPGICNVPKP